MRRMKDEEMTAFRAVLEGYSAYFYDRDFIASRSQYCNDGDIVHFESRHPDRRDSETCERSETRRAVNLCP